MSGKLGRWLVLAALAAPAVWTCTSRPLEPRPESNETGGAPTAAAGGRSAGGASSPRGGASSATDAGVDAEQPECGATPASDVIPPGWVRFPGLPCACELWVAPSAEHMGPVPSWRVRSDGVLELEKASPEEDLLPGSGLGDSFQGEVLVAFGKDLGLGVDAASAFEWIVLRLPSNEIVFRGRRPGSYSSTCGLYIKALGQGNVLHLASKATTGLEPTAWALAGGPARTGAPDLLYSDPSGWEPLGGPPVIGKGVVGTQDQRGAWAMVLDRTLAAPERLDAGRVPLAPLGAWDGTLFLQEYVLEQTRGLGSVYAWDKSGGLRPLVARTGDGPDEVAAACGLGTDGETMVWTQYSGWDRSNWGRIDLMKAPFTADAARVRPVRLTTLRGGDGSCRTWRVGGGYAAGTENLESGRGAPEQNLVVRLSDGQAFTLPEPPPDRLYTPPLYVSKDEVAAEQYAPNGVVEDTWEVGTIVRIPLPLLRPRPAPERP